MAIVVAHCLTFVALLSGRKTVALQLVCVGMTKLARTLASALDHLLGTLPGQAETRPGAISTKEHRSTPRYPPGKALAKITARQHKSLENRLRRAAERQGLRLEKSRFRDPYALTYGTYALIEGPARAGDNWRSRVQVAGDPNTGYGLNLRDVALYLFGRTSKGGRS